MVRKIVTWIVVADGARARIYRNEGPGKGLVAEPELSMSGDRRHAQDILTDKPGRTFDSHGQGRHAMEPTTDPREVVERQFAADLVAQLEGASDAGNFDRLILAAAPRTLGDLRTLMSKGLAAKVSAELAKDLTRAPSTELPKHLENVIAL